jgi:hypothetical protein
VPNNKTSINGFIVVLEVEGDYWYNTIIAYTKFGIKPVLVEGELTRVYFHENDLLYNPPEREMNISFQGNNRNSSNVELSMRFKNYSQSSNIILNDEQHSGSYSILIPSELPLYYNFKIKSELNNQNGYSEKIITAEKNENPVIYHTGVLQLVSPVENAVDADENTELIFDSPLQMKTVNVFGLGTFNHYMEYYTTSKSIRIRDFIDAGFVFEKNKKINWYVIQYYPFNNIDELCSGNYLQKYSDKLQSKFGSFTTKP